MNVLGPAWAGFLLLADPEGSSLAAQRFTSPVVELQLAESFDDPAYVFCHDPEFPLSDDEAAAWCPLLEGGGTPRCPAFDDACSAPRAVLHGTPGRYALRDGDEGGGEASPRDGAEAPSEVGRAPTGQRSTPRRSTRQPPEREAETPLQLPDLGGLGLVLFWIVVGVALVGLIVAVVRGLRKNPSDPPTADARSEADDPGAEALPYPGMTGTSAALLRQAEEAAARGEYQRAVDFLHGALLRSLDEAGKIHLHRSRTSGDYLGDLATHHDLRPPVSDALGRIESIQFGGTRADRRWFDDIAARVRGLAGRLIPLLLLVGLVAPLACGDERNLGDWDHSPSGTAALRDLVESFGGTATYREMPLVELAMPEVDADDEAEARAQIVLLLGGFAPSTEEWLALERFVDAGGYVFVASGTALPERFDTSYVASRAANQACASWANDAGDDAEPMKVVVPGVMGLDMARVHGVLVDCEEVAWATSFDQGDGAFFVFTDDSMFTNAGLTMADNAQVLAETIGRGAVDLQIVDAWIDFGAESPLESVANAHLLPALLQLMVLLAVLFLWRGVHFGQPRDPKVVVGREFHEHALALANHLGKAKGSGYAASVYARFALERLRDRFRLQGRGGLHALAQALSQRTGRDDTELMQLLVEAHGAVESGNGTGSLDGDLTLVRALGELLRR